MKQILSIASVYIGLVIGAGFASGREIFEYFNLSSQTDFTGIIFAVFGFGILAYIIMKLSSKLNTKTFDQFLESVCGKSLAVPMKIFMALFMFCGFFVMHSASGTLFESSFNMTQNTGIFVLSIICFVIFAFDTRGLVAANSFMVPIMICGMVVLCIYSILFGTSSVFKDFTYLRQNFIVSALCYVSYNTITAGAVLIPISQSCPKKDLRLAAIISSSVLGGLIFLVWTTLNIYYEMVFSSQMPLLDLAGLWGNLCQKLYGIILFMALCTTAISHGFGILSKFSFKSSIDRILASLILCLLALPFAKLGFSDLVSHLYSFFGFLGFLWTAIVVFKYIKLHKK